MSSGDAEPRMFAALTNAVIASEAAAQAVLVLWDEMTFPERDLWLETRATEWPRRDAHLPGVLIAAESAVAAENEIRRNELPGGDLGAED